MGRKLPLRVERIGDATLYRGDCREIVLTLPRAAALIGDPPYGQNLKANVGRCKAKGRSPASPVTPRYPPTIIGDNKPFDPTSWLLQAPIVLLWGAHKFADRLPPGQWLLWDKVPNGKRRTQGDGEAAWTNTSRPLRIFRLLWDGVCVGSAARWELTAGTRRVHPCQKPVALMEWCIAEARVPSGGLILDPWMGAGSTGIAALRMGHPFIGIEMERQYFDAACRRIERQVTAARKEAA